MGITLRKKIADIAERALWTFAQGGLGLISAEMLDIPVAWVPLFMMALSALKGYVASRVGTGSAATLPIELERK